MPLEYEDVTVKGLRYYMPTRSLKLMIITVGKVGFYYFQKVVNLKLMALLLMMHLSVFTDISTFAKFSLTH